jgi:hypothetical protein
MRTPRNCIGLMLLPVAASRGFRHVRRPGTILGTMTDNMDAITPGSPSQFALRAFSSAADRISGGQQ